MPLAPKSYQDVYDLIKTKIQASFPDADFNEGSFNDIYGGAIALAYQELQAYSLEQFRKTFFENPANTGEDLETLAVDHFDTGAARPDAQKAIGTLTVTRDSGNNAQITIAAGTVFSANEKDYVARDAVTILAANSSGSVLIEASEAGKAGNQDAGQTWKTSISDVTVTNGEPLQGGTDALNDQEYRDFIKNFILSVQDGTVSGLEGAARLVPGVGDARVIRKLYDVGTLDSAGALKTTGVVKFKAVQLLLYISSAGTSAANAALRAAVENKIKEQLSAGETISVLSASPLSIDLNISLTFTSSTQALALATREGTT